MVAMATILPTIFLFDLYALIISIVVRSTMYSIKVMIFLQTYTIALILNSPVKGLKKFGLERYQNYTAKTMRVLTLENKK